MRTFIAIAFYVSTYYICLFISYDEDINLEIV